MKLKPTLANMRQRIGNFSFKLIIALCLLGWAKPGMAQYSTFSFTDWMPSAGPVQGGNDFCYSNSMNGLNYTHCGGTGMPAYFSSGAPKPQFRAWAPSNYGEFETALLWYPSGLFISYSPFGGMYGTVGGIEIVFDNSYPADFGGLTFYQNTGSSQNYTIYAYADHGATSLITSEAVSIPSGTATAETIAGTAGTKLVRIVPASGHQFGVNDFLLAEPVLCNNPDVPTLSVTNSSISYGDNVTISIQSGNLDDADDWEWYSGSCGGTHVGSGNSINVSPSATTTYYVRGEGNCVTPGACASTTITVNPLAITWTGAVSDNWGTAGNWSPATVPNNCMHSAVIASVARPPVLKSAITVGTLQLQASSVLTLEADLTLCSNLTGGITNFGTVSGTSKLILAGSGSQQVSGRARLNKLQLNNASGAVLQAGANIQIIQSLELRAGNFNATTGTLTFKSTSATNCAILDNFSSGFSGTFTGNVSAERYYNSSSTHDQHYMGSPVNSPSLGQFGADGTPGFVKPTADCDETELAYRSPYGKVFSYDESNGSDCSLAGWMVETGGTADNGRGYSILKEGAGTLTISGEPNLGSQYTVGGLTNSGWSNTTKQGRMVTSGWNLVANPYLATIDISSNGGDFDNQVQVWHSQGAYAGTYQASFAGSNAVVAPFQAFMVHKSNVGGSASYTLYGSDRTTGSATFYRNINGPELTIVAANHNNSLLDKTVVAYNPEATAGFDRQVDANKIPGALDRHAIYTICNNNWMSYNTLHTVTETPDVVVNFYPGVSGAYSFSFEGLNSFDATQFIVLEDKKLNVMHDVRSGKYNFTATTTDMKDRFVLHFTPAADITATNAECGHGEISMVQEGPANWNYTLRDSKGEVISTGAFNKNEGVALGVAKGQYTITLVSNGNYTVEKTISVEGTDAVNAAIGLSRSVVMVNQPVLFTSLATGASQHNWQLGDGTEMNGEAISHQYQQEGNYTVKLNAANSDCEAGAEQVVTVLPGLSTGINDNANTGELPIWSHNHTIFVDFNKAESVNATISVINLIGQELMNAKFAQNGIYAGQVNNVPMGYVLVKVQNNNQVTYKKVLLN